MIRIGLTGGIGSGKTSVSKWFAQKGIPVFDADQVVHQLYADKDGKLVTEIGKLFGADCIADGRIDRYALGQVVFNNPDARAELEALVHPRVMDEMLKQCQEAELAGNKMMIIEIPLLLEKGFDKRIDEVWVVYVPSEIQIKRLMQRNNMTREEAVLRINSQMPLAQKKEMAHIVIDNSGSWAETEKQLDDLWRKYT
ncbi:dephospho-CoA kinase [Dehalobacter sp. DCM]|uniref:dephospho-CoA kinase n=1 Tax=Dehalobacter sp. DCM TaxID=2907827 RepID=UPI0030812737|nr:dephospho-CoA kinase [Dehalobacter sp. DCM]